MKKFLVIFSLTLFSIINIAEAETKDIGQGLTINIPNNYEYFEITLGKIYSEFPEIDNSDDDFLNDLGIANKTKFVVIAKNKKTIKFFKEISNSEGFEKLKEEFWEPFMEDIQGEGMLNLLEKEFKKMGKDPNKMSQKKIEETIMKISQKPSFIKKIDEFWKDNPLMVKFKKEYSFDIMTILIIGDKKITADLAKVLEITSPSEIKKNIKDFIKLMAKEDPTMRSLKKWKFEVKKNHNGKLYLYSDDPIDDPYTKNKADYSEVFLSTNREKIFLGYSICSETCKKTDLLEIITPTNLFVKFFEKTETKETKKIVEKKVEKVEEEEEFEFSGYTKKINNFPTNTFKSELKGKTMSDLVFMNDKERNNNVKGHWNKNYFQWGGKKAWAESQSEAWAWESSLVSERDAVKRAVDACNRHNSNRLPSCVVTNVSDKHLTYKEQADWMKEIYGETTLAAEIIGNKKKKVVKKKKSTQTDSNNSLSQQIKDLNEMYESGALTKEQFKKAKKKLLN